MSLRPTFNHDVSGVGIPAMNWICGVFGFTETGEHDLLMPLHNNGVYVDSELMSPCCKTSQSVLLTCY